MDFLLFKTFISKYILIAFYYIGVFVIPFIAWLIAFKIAKRFPFLKEQIKKNQQLIWQNLPTKYKILITLCFFICFIFMQIFWRMMIEFLVAYMQIRDALVVK